MCAWKKHEAMTIASDDVYRGQTTGRRTVCVCVLRASPLSLSFSGEIGNGCCAEPLSSRFKDDEMQLCHARTRAIEGTNATR